MTINEIEVLRTGLQKSFDLLLVKANRIQIGNRNQFPYGWRKAAKERARIEEENKKKAQVERTKEMIKKYGSYNGKLIAEGKVAIGMNQKMVIDSWGKPSDINRDIYSFGVHEQWVYGSGNYVYFKDGVVSSISTRK